jgi:hypothetical protein
MSSTAERTSDVQCGFEGLGRFRKPAAEFLERLQPCLPSEMERLAAIFGHDEPSNVGGDWIRTSDLLNPIPSVRECKSLEILTISPFT